MVISIPAFREEGDLFHLHQYVILSVFQSPPSVRKATTDDDIWAYIFSFQSPPSVRKATELTDALEELDIISIPAFREEGDLGVSLQQPR